MLSAKHPRDERSAAVSPLLLSFLLLSGFLPRPLLSSVEKRTSPVKFPASSQFWRREEGVYLASEYRLTASKWNWAFSFLRNVCIDESELQEGSSRSANHLFAEVGSDKSSSSANGTIPSPSGPTLHRTALRNCRKIKPTPSQ